MQKLPIFYCLLCVSACTPVKNAGVFMASNLRDGVHHTVYAIEDWTMASPDDVEDHKLVDDRYCYRVQTDILCYTSHMPGMEQQLVSYQGSDALPPPQIAMRLLPKSSLNEDRLPENKVKLAKPVVAYDAQADADNNASDAGDNGEVALSPDVGSEILPDPSNSPQL